MNDEHLGVRHVVIADRISHEELVKIAKIAAEIAIKEVVPIASAEAAKIAKQETLNSIKTDFYRAVGEGVVNKALWIIGALVVAAYVWARQHGLIK